MRLHTLQPLTLVHRPWIYTAIACALGFSGLVAGTVRTVRVGVSMDSTWGPLTSICVCAIVGSLASQYWAVTFDRASRVVRWRIRSIRGVKCGEISYDDVVGVSFPAARSSNRRPPRGIALVLADGTSMRLSQFSTVHKGFERLQRIGSLIRNEVGIAEPCGELEIADAISSASSDLQAVKVAKDLLGVPLSEARTIARGVRGRSLEQE